MSGSCYNTYLLMVLDLQKSLVYYKASFDNFSVFKNVSKVARLVRHLLTVVDFSYHIL